MKAWRIDLNECDTVYVLAPTRDKATARAIKNHPEVNWWAEMRAYGGFSAISRKRIPELDGDAITHQQLCDLGLMWTECYGCGKRIEHGGREGENGEHIPAHWVTGWTPFCSKACYDAHPSLHRSSTATGWDDPEVVFLSTEY